MNNKKEILFFIDKLVKEDERVIDIIMEVQRRYKIEIERIIKILTTEQKNKMKEQELKNYKTIKGN